MEIKSIAGKRTVYTKRTEINRFPTTVRKHMHLKLGVWVPYLVYVCIYMYPIAKLYFIMVLIHLDFIPIRRKAEMAA